MRGCLRDLFGEILVVFELCCYTLFLVFILKSYNHDHDHATPRGLCIGDNGQFSPFSKQSITGNPYFFYLVGVWIYYSQDDGALRPYWANNLGSHLISTFGGVLGGESGSGETIMTPCVRTWTETLILSMKKVSPLRFPSDLLHNAREKGWKNWREYRIEQLTKCNCAHS